MKTEGGFLAVSHMSEGLGVVPVSFFKFSWCHPCVCLLVLWQEVEGNVWKQSVENIPKVLKIRKTKFKNLSKVSNVF